MVHVVPARTLFREIFLSVQVVPADTRVLCRHAFVTALLHASVPLSRVWQQAIRRHRAICQSIKRSKFTAHNQASMCSDLNSHALAGKLNKLLNVWQLLPSAYCLQQALCWLHSRPLGVVFLCYQTKPPVYRVRARMLYVAIMCDWRWISLFVWFVSEIVRCGFKFTWVTNMSSKNKFILILFWLRC